MDVYSKQAVAGFHICIEMNCVRVISQKQHCTVQGSHFLSSPCVGVSHGVVIIVCVPYKCCVLNNALKRTHSKSWNYMLRHVFKLLYT